ncbi:MAG: hypothetical protein H7843_11340 [Nitrospirota bacterium]
MDRGTVLFHRDFQFKDGEYGNKLIIILNDVGADKPYLCCKTTSKPKYGIEKEGCYSDKNIFVLSNLSSSFHQKTYVQFHELYELNSKTFLKGHFEGKVEIICKLPVNMINAIINCIKKSEDISPYHLMLLK